MLGMAEQAFWPAKIPFPVMHVDTGHNFSEVLEFRDRRVAEAGVALVVAWVQESIDKGRVVEETGRRASRNRLQTTTLLDAIRSTSTTRCLAAPAETRRRPGPRSGCSRSATSSASGTRRISGPSCGTSTTPGSGRASTSGCSRCPTGPSWTSGNTSREGTGDSVHLLRPHPPGVRAGRHAAGRQRVHHRTRTSRSSRSASATARWARCPAPGPSSQPRPRWPR